MNSRWKPMLLGGAAAIAMAAAAMAQDAAPAPAAQTQAAPATAAPFYDTQQLPAYQGQVQLFTLTPRGDVDGLIMSDGTEIKTPPHLSTALAYAVKLGDTVTVHGLRAAALPLIQAASITDEGNGQTVVDTGPSGRGRDRGKGPAGASGGSEVQGKIRMALHGPRGEVNGALLDDGTVLRLPPPEASRLASLLQPGQPVVAEGVTISNSLGTVLEVRQLGASRDQLSPIAMPGPGHGGKRPPHAPPPPA